MKTVVKTTRFNTPDDSPGFLLWRTTTCWQRELKKVLSLYGITHTQFVLLATMFWLSEQSQVVTQVQISLLSNVDTMTISTVVRGLQKKVL